MKNKEETLKQRAERYVKIHKAACEAWDNGEVTNIRLDEAGVLCICYENGKWYHYSEANGELFWW